MLRLDRPTPDAGPGRRAYLFGVGLVGSRVGLAFSRRGWRGEEIETPWNDPEALSRQLAALARGVRDAQPARLDVIWSAGRAGFSSTAEETAPEEENFRRVLEFATDAAGACPGAAVFHLTSSAGGLFEGQRHVDRSSRPSPRRPYGNLKLRLEKRLEAVGPELAKRIYRLSSVFGPATADGRRGLISTLLHDARDRRTTRIFGQLTTLRDYVWTEDIGRYLAEAAETPPPRRPRIELLASGKPTSIHEILHLVEGVVGRRPGLRYTASRSNSSDITFAASALPPGWHPSDLATSLRQVASDSLGEEEISFRKG